MDHTVHNERTKLTATWLNGISIALVAVGGLAPIFTTLQTSTGPTLFLVFVSLICFSLAIGLHLLARWVLKGMRS